MNLGAKFEEALVFAFRAHREQQRKGAGVPYISHLMGVAGIALDFGADEDEAIAALLHDAAEDQGGRPMLERIRRKFGERVAECVEGCTDSFESPKPPWRARKEAYVARVRHEPASVQLISAADKLHNVQSIVRDHRLSGERVWGRFSAGKEEIAWYYRSLVEAFRAPRVQIIAGELELAVRQLERLTTS